MRVYPAVLILSVAVIAATVALGIKTRNRAIELKKIIAGLIVHQDTLRASQHERDRLRTAVAEIKLRQGRRVGESSNINIEPTAASARTPALRLGEWSSSGEWRNEGQSTATHTVATLLWAAAGGDVATVGRIIAFDEAGQKRAQAFFEKLPPDARQNFQSPESLVASLTVQAIPDKAAQLTWVHERDPDHVTVALLLGALDPTPTNEVLAVTPKENRPIALAENDATKLAVLSLQRSAGGWRVVIPAAAIERLAGQFATLSKP